MKDNRENMNENNNQDDVFYNNFENNQPNNMQNNMNNNVNQNMASNYQNNANNDNGSFLDSHTQVTGESKFSRFILFGFYLLVIIIGVAAVLMIRANKYEFYLKKEEVSLNKGSTYQVELTPKDVRYFDYSRYNYSIADEKVATVDEYGKITAVGAGKTTLTISLSPGFNKKTMTIISEDISLDSITLRMYRDDEFVEGNTIEMSPNQSIKLKAVANGRDEMNTTVSYSSSDKSVAVVDEFGNVVAKSTGTAVITGSRDGVEGSITISVKSSSEAKVAPAPKKETVNEITSVGFTSGSVTVSLGKTYKLPVSIVPKTFSASNLTWLSSDTSIATVDSNGIVKGIGVGSATITAQSANGKTATCNVTVTNQVIEITKISLNATKKTIKVNGTFNLVATITPKNATDGNVIWSSSNTKVATVSQSGVVKGVGAGTATITAKSENGKVKATSEITVEKKDTTAKKVVIDISNTELYVGQSLVLSASLSPSSSNSSVSWSSSKTSVATVDKNGVVRAVGAGTVTITATIDGVKGNCTIVIRNKANSSTPTPKATATPKQSGTVPSIPKSTFNSKYIKVSVDKIELSKGEKKKVSIKLYNGTGMFGIKTKAVSGDSTVHISVDKTETTVLEGVDNSGAVVWAEDSIEITGNSSGYSYVVIEPGRTKVIEYDSFNYLEGSHTILVHVK